MSIVSRELSVVDPSRLDEKQGASSHSSYEPNAMGESSPGSLSFDPSQDYTGNLDRVHAMIAEGWVIGRNDLNNPVVIEIWLDDVFVAAGEASILRGDLKDAGIGDGYHGFSIPIPIRNIDGSEHIVTAKVSGSDYVLPGSATVICTDMAAKFYVDSLDGLTLKCRIRATQEHAPYLCDILADGKVIDRFTSESTYDNEDVHFSIGISALFCDGSIHWFQLQERNSGATSNTLVVITPIVLTPESALQTYARSFSPSLSAQAARRYRSLQEQLGSLSNIDDLQKIRPAIKQLLHAHKQVTRGIGQQQGIPHALAFHRYDEPLVSIVMPVHNKFWVTYNCLSSLLLAFNKASFEIIVVDDGSSDLTLRLGEIVRGIKIIRNEESVGFVISSNRGAEVARGQFVVMLNNDVEVCCSWIDELLAVFDKFDNVGLSGAKLVYPDGSLQEAGGIIFPNHEAWNYGRHGNPHEPRYNYVRQVDYISGACIMLRKKVWDELGGFDQLYAPAYYEDTDLAFRLRARGLKTYYTPFAEVVHFEGVSSGTSITSGFKRFQAINRPKFRSRWAATLRSYPSTLDPEIAKDRGVELRALVIDHQVPQPDKDAGSFAAIQEMRLLQALGFKLTFAPVNLAYLGNYTEDMQKFGVECLYAPFQSSIERVIEDRGREFDLVYITRYAIADRYIDLIRQCAPNAKIVFNNADLHFLREIRTALVDGDRNALEGALRTRDSELSVMRRTDLTLTYTETEAAVIVSHNLDTTKIARCPWVVEVSNNVLPFERRSGLAFLGNYNHPPNLQAMKFFITQVMPELRRKIPHITIDIYGSHVPDELRKLESEGVHIRGWVEDVAEVYNTCRVFVAPLRTGAGIKGKVIGALAAGTPVVMSSIAAEGIGASRGSEAAVADTPQEWVEAITSLYDDGERWTAMSYNAQALARRSFSFQNGLTMMRQALEAAGLYVG